MLRYSRGDREFIVPLNVPGIPFNGYFAANEFLPQVINNRGAVLSHTHTFSPHLINEARVGFNRLYATVTPRSQGKNLATDFGVRGVPDDKQSNGLTAGRHHRLLVPGRQLRYPAWTERLSGVGQCDGHRGPAFAQDGIRPSPYGVQPWARKFTAGLLQL